MELMALTGQPVEDVSQEQQETLNKNIPLHVNKDEIVVRAVVIQHLERLETEEEVKRRKEEEERKAAMEK